MVRKIKLKEEKKKKTLSKHLKLIKENLKTPFVPTQFNSLVKPIFFPGTTVPRYRICTFISLKEKENTDFLKILEEFAKENEVEKIGKLASKEKVLLSFQGRDQPELFIIEKGSKKREKLELEHDMPTDINCQVEFNINMYVDRRESKNLFNFAPLSVTYLLDEKAKKLIDCE